MYNYQNQNKNQLISNLFNQLRYTQRYLAEQQVKQLLHQIHSLQPSKDTFIANNGHSEVLLKLEGTIPMTYQGRQYNIPVRIWLPSTFPMHAPRCFVTPVNGMSIRPQHKLVDMQGFVYHPYLSNWNQNRGSSLSQLTAILSQEFGKSPPVYSGPPPKSNFNNFNNRMSYNQNNFNKPRPQPIQNQWQNNQNRFNNNNQNNYNSNLQQNNNNNNMNRNQNQQNIQFNNIQNSQNNNSIYSQQNNNQNNNNSNIINKNKNNNIKSQFENKIKPHLKDCYDNLNKECKSLSTKRKEIEEHASKLDKIEDDLREENEKLLQRKQDLSEKIQYLEKWIKENDSNKEISVNDIVKPSDLWSQQCMENSAKDFAGTDSLLELDKAIDEGSIKSLDTYLKAVRKVARQQFLDKALAKVVFEKQDNMVRQKRQQRN